MNALLEASRAFKWGKKHSVVVQLLSFLILSVLADVLTGEMDKKLCFCKEMTQIPPTKEHHSDKKAAGCFFLFFFNFFPQQAANRSEAASASKEESKEETKCVLFAAPGPKDQIKKKQFYLGFLCFLSCSLVFT